MDNLVVWVISHQFSQVLLPDQGTSESPNKVIVAQENFEIHA